MNNFKKSYGYIYVLIETDSDHPLFGDIRYVGQSTKKKPQERLNNHLSSAISGRSHRDNWIVRLKNKKLKPIMRLIYDANNQDDLDNAEIYWIKYFREQGCRLVNRTAGGGGLNGFKHSEETKKKMSLAGTGKAKSEEHCKKISLAKKGKSTITEEGRRRISEAVKNRIIKDSTRRKLSEGRLGKKNPMFGHSFSEEHRKKISEAGMGRKVSEETRIHQSKMKGGRAFKDQHGNVYFNIRKTAELLGIKHQNLWANLHKKAKQTNGYIFEFI